MNLFVKAAAALALLSCAACADTPPSSDQQQRRQQEQLSAQGNSLVGMPAITNFFEKKMYKRILEMRDDPHLITYTYTRDMNGKLHLLCRSIGFPIPAATQYTNPSRLASEYQLPNNGTNWSVSASVHTVDGVVPQPDPNGLYSPATADATWVMCQNPENPSDLQPAYNENRLETFRWPVQGALPN